MLAVMLSVVIPAYNEALRLPRTLERMRAFLDSEGEDYEVILVDDGSTDDTLAGRPTGRSWRSST